MNSIKIVSGGHGFDTRVFNSDGGEINGIASIEIEDIKLDSIVTATLKLTQVKLELYSKFRTATESANNLTGALWEFHPLKQWANRKTGK